MKYRNYFHIVFKKSIQYILSIHSQLDIVVKIRSKAKKGSPSDHLHFKCYIISGVVEGGLGGAEPPLLKFHVDLGGLSPPPIIFARCIILNGNVL